MSVSQLCRVGDDGAASCARGIMPSEPRPRVSLRDCTLACLAYESDWCTATRCTATRTTTATSGARNRKGGTRDPARRDDIGVAASAGQLNELPVPACLL